MAGDNRGPSSLFRRAEQLRRWQESETNKQEVTDKVKKRKVKFSDGCIFLAASAAGDKDELKRLLEKEADINTINQDGITALHAACIDNNLEIVEFLVDNNADINRCDMEGWTPLHATASCGSISMAEFLISRGADLSVVNNDGELAIDVVDEDDMAKLLQEEMDRRGIDSDASRSREERHMLEDAQYWLNNGNIIEKPHPKTGATALHVASAKGYIPVLRILIESGADVQAKDLDGWTPLHAAAHWRQTEAVEILCDNMADMDVLNSVGQSPYDLADDTLKCLMDELRRKQKLLNKVISKKRKTSPHKDRSNKKDRDSQRGESDGMSSSSDDSSSHDVEKRTSNRDGTLLDHTEVQSWRRPSLRNKILNERRILTTNGCFKAGTKNNHVYEDSKEDTIKPISNVSSPIHVNNKDDEVILRKDSTSNKEDRVNLLSSAHRQKALSCLTLGPSSGISKEGENWGYIHSNGIIPSHNTESSNIPSNLRRTISLSSDVFSTKSTKDALKCQSSAEENVFSSPSQIPFSTRNSCIIITSLTTTLSTTPNLLPCDISSSESFLRRTNSLSEYLDLKRNATTLKTKSRNSSFELSLPSKDFDQETSSYQPSMPLFSNESSLLISSSTFSSPSQPSNQRLSTLKFAVTPSISTPLSSVSTTFSNCNRSSSCSNDSPVDTKIINTRSLSFSNSPTHSYPIFPLSSENESSTNLINKNPEVLARSQSLKARIQRNCQDILKIQDNNYVTTTQTLMSNSLISTSPSKLSSSVLSSKANGSIPSPPKNVPSILLSPNPDPPSPTGPTVSTSSKLTAGSVIKNFFKSFVPPSRDDESETQRKAHAKLVRSTRRSTQGITLEDVKSAEQFMKTKQVNPTSTASDSSTTSPTMTTTIVSITPIGASDLANSSSDTNTSNSASNKDSSFSPESPLTKDNSRLEVENEVETTTITLPLRKKSISEDKKEDKLDDKGATTREGTQAVIQRRKKAKRRSTGVVHVDIEDIDPDKKENKDEDKEVVSVSDREGSSSKTSSQSNSRPASRSSSVVGSHNGDIDYKKLYEEQLSENDKLMERLRNHERELRVAKETIDNNNKAVNARSLMAETERREKRSLERKLSEMEEELRQLQKLKAENEKLRAENRALTRVVSKLTNSATTMSNFARK